MAVEKIAGKKVFQQAWELKNTAMPRLAGAVQALIHPDVPGLKAVAADVWVKIAGFFGAVCACFRRPGLSEAAAVTAFGISVVGPITACFCKKARRLMPLFSALAALGAVIVILRCIFPRNRD